MGGRVKLVVELSGWWSQVGGRVKCVDLSRVCVPTCVQKCAQICDSICVQTCMDMRTDMCADMCADMCTDMCADMWIDVCIDMCADLCWPIRKTRNCRPSCRHCGHLKCSKINIGESTTPRAPYDPPWCQTVDGPNTIFGWHGTADPAP